MNYAKYIQNSLEENFNPVKAEWLEGYVKHDIRSRGIGIPKIREIVKKAVKEHRMNQLPLPEQIAILDGLMLQDYTEDKLAAILFIQLYWPQVEAPTQLQLISKWFDHKWINDWNVCDWLCVRILSRLIDEEPQPTIETLRKWNHHEYLWKARASLVPFAQCKSITDHRHPIKDFSAQLIKRDERFAKTAVGWVLREYSKHDPDFVQQFLEDHQEWTTPEVIRNATKYVNR